MGPIWDLFKAALGWTIDVSRDMVIAYWEFLKKLGKWSIIVALILLPLPIVGSLLHMSWMSGIYMALIGLLISVWLVAAFPVVMLVRYAYEEIKSIKKTAQLIGGVLFWILLLSIYFYLIPVWNYPAAIPLIFIICAILALGFMRFGIGINPKLAIGVVLIVFCLITISFYMPTTRSAASTFVEWLDKQVAGLITSPLHPSPQVPKRTNYDHISIEKIVFFDLVTGEPRVWYYKGEGGRFELFDGPGYHPQYKVKLEPITPDIVAQIKSKLKADAEIKAQEEQKKREEAERIAKKKQEEAEKLANQRESQKREDVKKLIAQPIQDEQKEESIKGTAKIDFKQTLYFGGDWLTVILDSFEIIDNRFIRFNFTFVNPFEDEARIYLKQPEQNTYIVDNLGNSYNFVSSIGITARDERRLRPRERVTVSVMLDAHRRPAKYITLRTKWYAYGRGFGGDKELVVRNIPITRL